MTLPQSHRMAQFLRGDDGESEGSQVRKGLEKLEVLTQTSSQI